MAFGRSLETKPKDVNNPKKCPPELQPQTDEERTELWNAWQENMGDYDKIKAKLRKRKSRKRKGRRGRVWTFVKDVKDDICKGNGKRAELMIKKLLAHPKRNRIHPDVSDEEEGQQVHCLEKDQDEEESESESEVSFTAQGHLQGDAAKQNEVMNKMLLKRARPEALPKAKAKAKMKAIEDDPKTEDHDESATAAERAAAEKAKKKE